MTQLKNNRTTVRFTNAEAAQVLNHARACGVTVSEWIRSAAVKRQIQSNIDLTALNELRRQGGLLKHLYNNGVLEPSKSYEVLCQLQTIAAQLIKE